MRNRSLVVLALFVIALSGLMLAQNRAAHFAPTLTVQNSGTTNSLIAVSPVNSRVVWAVGRFGTFTVTTDGGNTWHAGVIPGTETLQLRDVEGVSEKAAYAMSISPTGTVPGEFRIYKTEDGGATWTLQFQNTLDGAFYDCMAFWTPKKGITFSDSVNGVFPVIRTTDGTTWQSIADKMPPAQPFESSFASSGTCVATFGGQYAWIGTGGAPTARVLKTTDGGDTWSAYDTPFAQTSAAAGIFSVAFRNPSNGIIAGGDLLAGATGTAQFARSSDGGHTWTLTNPPANTGTIYGAAYVRGRGENGDAAVVATSPNGTSWSPDEGTTWYPLPGLHGLWAVAFATPQAGWLVGTNGQVVKMSF